ncbi:hypothetical protein MUO79_10850 [Candidatus Bathyarchaeota archaeon]|nr:hypothetical protein [Candidatus Bathyarchaeota archaeon]
MEAIKKADKSVDDAPIESPPAYQPPGHFDRDPRETSKQAFERNAEFVRKKKQEAIDALKRCDTEAAIKAIGEALHAIQDFYSHSNYVDLTPAEQAAARNAFDNPCTSPPNLRLEAYYPIPSLLSPAGKWNPLSYNPQSLAGTAALWWLGVTGLIKETDPRDGKVYDHGLADGKHKDNSWSGDGPREITRDEKTGEIVPKNTPGSVTKTAFEWAMEEAKKHSKELIDQIIEAVGQALWDHKLGNYTFPPPPDPKPSVPLPDPKWKLYPYPYPYPYHRQNLQVGVFGLVPPGGGILDDGEGTAVFVPSGAVPTPEWFYALSVSPEDLFPSASLPEGVSLIKAREFWPDGMQFQEPVTISIVYSLSEIIGVAESSLRAYEFDLYHDGEWRLIPESTLDTVNRTVTFQTSHFSIYGIGGSPPLPVGGISIPVDKFGLLAPYIGLASTAMIGAVATVVYVRRAKRREEKQ